MDVICKCVSAKCMTAADRKNREGGLERSLEGKLGGEEADAQDGCGHSTPAQVRTAGRRPGDEGRKQ